MVDDVLPGLVKVARAGWVRGSAAARRLAVSKSGLYLKIKKYGLRTSMK
jgi:transcriptional regulator of acetoin/glycerol metabolism